MKVQQSTQKLEVKGNNPMIMSHDSHVKENTLYKRLSSITNPYVHVCMHTRTHAHTHTHTKQCVNATKFQKNLFAEQNSRNNAMKPYQIKDSAVDTGTNF